VLGGVASASTNTCDDACRAEGITGQSGGVDHGKRRQIGLVNMNGTNVLRNADVVGALCGNEVAVLGVQVPVEDVANGVQVPLAAAGSDASVDASPDFCSVSGVVDQGVGSSVG